MLKENYNVIGVMSGTSLDGVDLAHVNLHFSGGKWNFTILEAQTIGYSQNWINQLKEAINYDAESLRQLNSDYTALLGSIISDFIRTNSLEVDAVCSHGHTILHQPENGITLQIGNLPEISGLSGQQVVCDFRTADVALGGQGAPLVPIGDRLLFPEYNYCLNLGGFSNISFEHAGQRIAFDISPVNTVLNHFAREYELDYDDRGKIAASGQVSEPLLHQLNSVEYYKSAYPKSLGFEFVNEIILPLIAQNEIATADAMRTFVEHIAIQIALALPKPTGKMLITGGGAYNDFLIERIRFCAPHIEIVIPQAKVLEYKEALIFALLGVLRMREEINVLSSVTGAAKDHCSGIIYKS